MDGILDGVDIGPERRCQIGIGNVALISFIDGILNGDKHALIIS